MSNFAVTMRVSDRSQYIQDELTRLIDAASAPIFGVDMLGRITDWNQEAERILGWSKTEVAGKSLLETFITEEFKEEVAQVLCKALHGNETMNFELALFGKSGWRHDVLLNVATRRDVDGQSIGVFGFLQVITEASGLIAEQHKLAGHLEAADVPIFGASVDSPVTGLNRKPAGLSCYTKEFTLDRALVENFIISDYNSEVQEMLTEACHGVETASFEFPLVTAPGERNDVLLNATTRAMEKAM